MYSFKSARYLTDKVPDIKVKNFYSDLCVPGKSYQSFYEETKDKGVEFIRAEDVEVAGKSGSLEVKYKGDDGAASQSVVMVILAPALLPSEDGSKLAEMLNISLDDKGFFEAEHEKLGRKVFKELIARIQWGLTFLS